MKEAGTMLLSRCDALFEKLAVRAREHEKTPMIGRSHGIFAEPVTFGLALAGHAAEVKRSRVRLAEATNEIAVGKIAGAVGTYAHVTPEIEERALAALGLRAETVSTQIVARDRHAAFFSALALVRGGNRTLRDERAPLATLGGSRSRRGVHGRSKRIERDAAQTKSDPE